MDPNQDAVLGREIFNNGGLQPLGDVQHEVRSDEGGLIESGMEGLDNIEDIIEADLVKLSQELLVGGLLGINGNSSPSGINVNSSLTGMEELDNLERQVLSSTNPEYNQEGNPAFKEGLITESSLNLASIIHTRSVSPSGFFQNTKGINRFLVTKVVLRKNYIINRNKKDYLKKMQNAKKILTRRRLTIKCLDENNTRIDEENTKLAIELSTSVMKSEEDLKTIQKGKKWVVRLEDQVKKLSMEKRTDREEISKLKIENNKLKNIKSIEMDGFEDIEEIKNGGGDDKIKFETTESGCMIYPKDLKELSLIKNMEWFAQAETNLSPRKFFLYRLEGGTLYIFGILEGCWPIEEGCNCALCGRRFFYNFGKKFNPPMIVGAKCSFPSFQIGRVCGLHITGRDEKVKTINVIKKSWNKT